MKSFLFCDEMIRALLDGTKTQTRRMGPPRLQPGETVYVKEAWRDSTGGPETFYRADFSEYDRKEKGPWKSPLFMPESLSRLHLFIREVRVGPLWNITELDALAEGCKHLDGWTDGNLCIGASFADDPRVERNNPAWCAPGYRAWYATVWNQLQRKRPAAKRVPWSANPMVSAYTFEVLP